MADNGVSYYEAKEICAHLNEDGTEILEEEVNIKVDLPDNLKPEDF